MEISDSGGMALMIMAFGFFTWPLILSATTIGYRNQFANKWHRLFLTSIITLVSGLVVYGVISGPLTKQPHLNPIDTNSTLANVIGFWLVLSALLVLITSLVIITSAIRNRRKRS